MRDLLSIGTSRGCEMIGTGIGLGVSGFRVNPPGLPATLDLNFASTLSLTSSSGITPSFTRASTGSYFNLSGALTSASVNGPRFDYVYNGTNWVSKGLLVEEQRTNSLLQSNDFTTTWASFGASATANTVLSPEGTQNADTITAGSGTALKSIYQSGMTFSAANVSTSVYAKKGTHDKLQILYGGSGNTNYANFDLTNGVVGSGTGTLSMVNVGNGWYRCVHTTTSATVTDVYFALIDTTTATRAAAATTTGTVYLYGAQAEAGTFATSYIPTTTAAVTRSADVCQITGTDFSGFYNSSESSFAVEYDLVSTIPDTGIFYVNDGTVNNSFRLFGSLATNQGPLFLSRSASVTDGNIALSIPAVSSGKIVIGVKLNDMAGSLNGAAVVTDTSVAMPTGLNRLDLGVDHVPSRMNGHIARLRYYNKRLANSQLQGLSI